MVLPSISILIAIVFSESMRMTRRVWNARTAREAANIPKEITETHAKKTFQKPLIVVSGFDMGRIPYISRIPRSKVPVTDRISVTIALPVTVSRQEKDGMYRIANRIAM